MSKWCGTACLLSACLIGACLLPAASRAGEASAELARQLYQRAATALLAKNVPAAASELAKLVAECPDDELAPLAALSLAECHLAQGDNHAAIEVLKAWIPKLAVSARTQTLEPTAKLRAQLVLARAYYMADMLGEVIKIAREQTDIDRQLGATTASQKKLLEELETLADRASKRWQQSQAKWLQAASGQIRNGQYAEALESLGQCRPDELSEAWRWRYRLLHAQGLLGTGEASAALEELDRIDLEPLEDSERAAVRMACLDAAMALRQTRRAQAEINALTVLVKHDAVLAPTVALRAVEVATLRKDRNAARRLAQAAKETYPNFTAAHEFDLLLARNALASVQFDEARRILAALIDSPPAHDPSAAARAQWLLGESYFLSQDYRPAITAYTAVIDDSLTPAWKEVALMQRGKCYELLGEFAVAGADYRRVAEEFGASSFAATARTRLSEIDPYVRSANASTVPATQLK